MQLIPPVIGPSVLFQVANLSDDIGQRQRLGEPACLAKLIHFDAEVADFLVQAAIKAAMFQYRMVLCSVLPVLPVLSH